MTVTRGMDDRRRGGSTRPVHHKLYWHENVKSGIVSDPQYALIHAFEKVHYGENYVITK